MARRKREIPAAERERLARIRAEAAEARTAAIDGGPDRVVDPVGAVAWLVVLLGEDAAEVVGLVGVARRWFEWRELAPAFGVDPDDDLGVRMLAQRVLRRRPGSPATTR